MIAVQAMADGLRLVTRDRRMADYTTDLILCG